MRTLLTKLNGDHAIMSDLINIKVMILMQVLLDEDHGHTQAQLLEQLNVTNKPFPCAT